ncbi:MAG: ABC transporter ATP-binding protein [Candidatus Bathyarchaeia archaeon]|nr:ABC transporter ATP-binding protein [Candidatus Bathyarchaeia archaeon]
MTDQDISIRIENVRKTFSQGKRSIEALKGISFSIKKGEIFCLLGPNGSGKTTTVKIVCGLLKPDSGEVRLYGKSVSSNPSLLKEVGVVLEGVRNVYPYLSVYENLKYYARISGFDGVDMKKSASELIAFFDLVERKNDPVSRLSLGMQQKVCFACALVHKPRILLLDEPTLGLDVITKREIIKIISAMRDEGKSILLTTHQMDIAEKLADRIAILNKGEIVMEGNPRALTRCFQIGEYKLTLIEEIDELPTKLIERFNLLIEGTEIIMRTENEEEVHRLLLELHNNGLHVLSLCRNMSLEESFVRLVRGDNP